MGASAARDAGSGGRAMAGPTAPPRGSAAPGAEPRHRAKSPFKAVSNTMYGGPVRAVRLTHLLY